MEFDEKPIGGGSKAQDFADEYPPGYDPNAQKDAEDKKEKLPLSVRIKSTVFKNRKEALEDLIELFKSTEDTNDPIFSEYVGLYSKFVADSHPACLEKEPTEFLKVITEKALPSNKQVLIESSYEIMSIFIEKGQKDDVLNALKMGLPHKNQKVQCCTIEAILEMLKRFGARKLDYLKTFFPEISKLCEATISSVKTLVMTFFKEAYKWVGDSVKAFTDKMKKQQIDELEKFIEEYSSSESMQPSRQSALDEEKELQKGGKGKAASKIDAFEMAIAQEIFSRFNEPWADKVISTAKWSEKKEMLDQLIKAATVPKLVPNGYYGVVQMCKKLLNDSNVQVQICAIKIAGLMAAGIRKPFQQSAKMLSTSLIEKLKDKKQPIVDEALKSLKNFFYCMTLEEFVEDLKEALADKNSGSKLNSMNLLLNCVEEEKYKQIFKQFFPLIRKLLDDSAEEVRNKTIQLVGKLKGYYTDSYTQQITLNLNQQKLSKIDQYASQVVPFQQNDPSSYGTTDFGNSASQSALAGKKTGMNQLGKVGLKQGSSNMNPQSGSQFNKGGSAMDIESDSILPKQDFSKSIDKALAKISEPKQQSKKEGLDMLEVLLAASNYKISPNGLSELVNALKKCLSESNKSLARQFIIFVAKFGEALGKEAKQYSKILVPAIISNLSDKQAQVRNDALLALDKWAELIGLETVINFIPQFLGFESLEIRNQLMLYIIKNEDAYLRSDLKSFVIPILTCLTDKNKEIRSLTEQIFEITLQIFPIAHFYDSVKDFKPAVVQQLRTIFERCSDIPKLDSFPTQNLTYSAQASSGPNTMASSRNQIESDYASSNGPQYKQNNYQLPNKNIPSNQLPPPPPQQQPQPQCKLIKKHGGQYLIYNCIQKNEIEMSTQSLKEKRYDMEEQRPWPLVSIDDELVEELIENVRQVGIPNDLRMKMFSYDNKKVMEAAQFVKDKISNASQISDLLLKWTFLRLWDQSSIVLTKLFLDMMKQIFECLKSEQYYLVDFELNIILTSMWIAMQSQGKGTEILNLIVQAHERLRLICSSPKILRFWIQKLHVSSTNCEQIILLLNSGLFTSELSNELGTLSKITAVASNSEIVTALLNTYGEHVMKAYGFEIAASRVEQPDQKKEMIVEQPVKPVVMEDEGFLEIKQNLLKLGNKGIDMKLYTIHYLNEVFQNQEKISKMIRHSDYIIGEITKYLSVCMVELKAKEIQYELFNQFLTLSIKIANTKQFIASVSLLSAKNLTETILTELILADESKEEKNAMAVLKQLNTLMLRVLENTPINNMFSILFDLLIINRRKNEYSKVIAIIIKCILKLTKVLSQDVKEVDIKTLFVRFHEYAQEFSNEGQKNDDMGIKAIKTMLSELAKIVDTPTLMESYHVLDSLEVKDQHIIKMIESITSSKAIHHSPLIKATPINTIGGPANRDKVSQLKLRYQQMTTNKSPAHLGQHDEETLQRSLLKISADNQTQHNQSEQQQKQQQHGNPNMYENIENMNGN